MRLLSHLTVSMRCRGRDRAEAMYERALSSNPNHLRSVYYLAQFYSRKGASYKARCEELYRRALEVSGSVRPPRRWCCDTVRVVLSLPLSICQHISHTHSLSLARSLMFSL
jgi:hypothetical protein